jgi:hypothetical protein
VNPQDKAPDENRAEPEAPGQDVPEAENPPAAPDQEAENPSEDPATAVAPVDEDDIPEAGR